jgi:hypothetical protein
MAFRQKYLPNIGIAAVRGWCLKYIDDAGSAPTRRATAQLASDAEKSAGRLRGDDLPVGVWVVLFYALTRGAYAGLGHVQFARKNADGSVEIHDSEVHAGARAPYTSIAQVLAWFGPSTGITYSGWSTQCDGREYAEEYAPVVASNDVIADQVIAGAWGTGDDRKARLAAAGYDYTAIQAIVNQKLGGAKPSLLPNDQIAAQVIAGAWGVGDDRKARLAAAGYDAAAVQAEVNAQMGHNAATKSNDQIANEVIAQQWGKGQERKDRLAAAGYDYTAIQALVNQKLGF